jgi:hypothetical protein
VSEEKVFESYPALAPGPDGAAYIAFGSNKVSPHAIYFTENTTGSFSQPELVTSTDAYQPALAVQPDGRLVLAYFDKIDGTFSDVYIRTSSNGGHTWGSPQVVSTSQTAWQVAPDLLCTKNGDIHVAWHEEDDEGLPGRVLYREFVPTLGWQGMVEAVASGGHGAFPSMASDSNDHIHMVYQLLTPADPPAKDNYEIWYRSSVP